MVVNHTKPLQFPEDDVLPQSFRDLVSGLLSKDRRSRLNDEMVAVHPFFAIHKELIADTAAAGGHLSFRGGNEFLIMFFSPMPVALSNRI